MTMNSTKALSPADDLKDWYEHRDELNVGDVFRLHGGDVIKLDRRVPGDGTDWYAAIWCWANGFSYEDWRLHPSDLSERLPDDFNK